MPKQPIRSHFRQLKKAQNSKQEGEGKKKAQNLFGHGRGEKVTDETNFIPASSQSPWCEPGAQFGGGRNGVRSKRSMSDITYAFVPSMWNVFWACM